MPRYDYKCRSCSYTFEVVHSIKEDPKIKCKKCNKICERQLPTRVYLSGTVGVDWNTDPSKVSDSMKSKAKKASKRKVSF